LVIAVRLSRIKVWNEDGVGVIAIDNGPENQITVDVMAQLMEALMAANQDSNVKWVALTATGSAFFTAGFDWGSLGEDYDSVREFVRVFKALVSLMVTLDKPIISILNGSAVGMGLELALLSDLTIAPPDVYLCYPEGSVGVPPAFSMPIIQGRLPKPLAIRLLSGEPITPVEAEGAGLLKVVPRGNLFGDAKSMITSIKVNALMRRLMNREVRLSIDEAESVLIDALMSRCLTHTSRDELIKAVKEARGRCRGRYHA